MSTAATQTKLTDSLSGHALHTLRMALATRRDFIAKVYTTDADARAYQLAALAHLCDELGVKPEDL